MLFNSLPFALFLAVVFALYWGLRPLGFRVQNALLLVAGYVFYGWWDPRFLVLLFLSSCVDYAVGIGLDRTDHTARRKALIAVSLVTQIGLLAVFKYHDFFALSLKEALAGVGVHVDPVTLKWVLPVGISFYTFQTLGYALDVYKRKVKAATDPLEYFAFVSFFPQLVAGPIERASDLLVQFQRPRRFEDAAASDGLRQMLWGLFKKAVIADNCAPLVEEIFQGHAYYSANTLVLGAVLFAFQIYCDFSGYSDIAIGCARLFGFSLTRNFAFPYFSRDIGEFWRRWHMSLTGWFREHLYLPLGGSRGSRWTQARNIAIVFLVSGLWHGANWTFLAWGALHAAFFLPLVWMGRHRRHLGTVAEGRALPGPGEALAMLVTFTLTTLAWVFFRASSIAEAFSYLRGLASWTLFKPSHLLPPILLASIAVLVAVEWRQRAHPHGLAVAHLPAWGRRLSYLGVFLLIFFLGRFAGTDFIYFQF